ncbi:MAG: 50S ribosomal protein L32 [Phycisphaeraceae bacterium]|nr:50S ribosomal protein L32 [Phycisphaeraceae bacterium]
MLPCQRKTHSQSGMRRSHKHATATQAVRCPNCGSAKRPHAACPECGYVRPGLLLATSREK